MGLWKKCQTVGTGLTTCDSYDSFFLGLPIAMQVRLLSKIDSFSLFCRRFLDLRCLRTTKVLILTNYKRELHFSSPLASYISSYFNRPKFILTLKGFIVDLLELGFNSRPGEMVHFVANGLLLMRRFFEAVLTRR